MTSQSWVNRGCQISEIKIDGEMEGGGGESQRTNERSLKLFIIYLGVHDRTNASALLMKDLEG